MCLARIVNRVLGGSAHHGGQSKENGSELSAMPPSSPRQYSVGGLSSLDHGLCFPCGHGLAYQRCCRLDQQTVDPDRFTGICKEASHSCGSVEDLAAERKADGGFCVNGG